MDKPKLIEQFEAQMKWEIEEAAKNGDNYEFHTYFIEFLETEKKNITIKGVSNRLKTKPFKGGVINYGIEQVDYAIKYLKYEQKKQKGNIVKEKGTARQSAIAFYYLYKSSAFPETTGEDSADARFIYFLTGHDYDSLRKLIHDPFKRKTDKTGKGTKSLLADFIKVKKQFEKIQFNKGLQLIEKDIVTLQNDLDSYELI